MSQVISSNLGYPRIGENREWKKALEAFWAGRLEEKDFLQELERIRLSHLKLQQDKGIDLIPVNDFSLYDQMLDTATMFGLVPKRFAYEGGPVPISTYYAMARGNKDATAGEMTKWFNTNYHYIVPELQGLEPVLTENRPLIAFKEAQAKLGIKGKPVLIGPYTFIKLSKGYEVNQFNALVEKFVPLYVQILRELEQAGAEWVQIDEPSLVTSVSDEDITILQSIYSQFKQAAPGLKIMLQTYFEAVEHYKDIVTLPVQGIGLDFVHGLEQNLSALQTYGFPADKILGVGIIDGRNIWRANYEFKLKQLEQITRIVPADRLILQSSSSLLHVPVTTKNESKVDKVILDALAFANEKLDEIVLITKALREGKSSIEGEIAANEQALKALNDSSARNLKDVQEAVEHTASAQAVRKSTFEVRRVLHQDKWKLPFLPTTTIGSFPQTVEVRQARLKFRKGEWTSEQYTTYVQAEIHKWIELQEQIGLDVLVHGEFERTDMVEFFGEKLGGFTFTRNGWVQSYGSRCVKPPVIYGDVQFLEPMTVQESVFAQSLTKKPVKGMLTGPITILNWSFVRDDQTRELVAYQIALALRHEVEALEKAGITMIQVDEPALREGLPLKKSDWTHYLDWSVLAFRLSTSIVQDTTQIHTHMCYCEFHDIMDSIHAMDADVISIETSRSHGELIHSLEENTYDKGIGLGVYDIHSPRVPVVDEMVNMIEQSLKVLDPKLFWINPDCGLKTRGIHETVDALRHMVQAAQIIRDKHSVTI